ncbi:hypothetical protein P3T39_006772 [Kitasatospora sp. GP82]|nr:hypothetical protein [Kitasatospora sp. GP82]
MIPADFRRNRRVRRVSVILANSDAQRGQLKR